MEKTAIFQGGIITDKLTPLASWQNALSDSSLGILSGVKKSLDCKKRNFTDTEADKLSEREQQLLSGACAYYLMAIQINDESRFDKQLDYFLCQISEAIFNALKNQVRLEHSRIHDAVKLIGQCYLDYLQDGIAEIAPEWNLEIGSYALDAIKMPEINIVQIKADVENKSETRYRDKKRKVKKWYSLWLFHHEEMYSEDYIADYKCLPNAQTICGNASIELGQQLDSLIKPFYQMILGYIHDLTETVTKERERVLIDFNAKLSQARQGYQDNYDKVVADWQPLNEQAKQYKQQLSKLTDTNNYL